MDPLGLADVLAEIISTKTISSTKGDDTHAHDPLITAPPELRLRWASPSPQDQGQNGQNCQQLSQQASESIRQANQSASQAIQQASQQADQSIRQASQSASQAIQQATQSASRGIQEAQNTARQAADAASRSVSSASSVVASISSSASAAIASANSRAQAAESQASSAVLQAGAAVAAATGSAAAAGSSFLAAAALATKSAQASVSGIVAQASSQVQIASVQAKSSQIQAVTATQAALAIVGSIIASALITILIYFLIARHKKKKEKRSGRSRARSDPRRDIVDSPNPEYMADKKGPPPSEQDGTTLVGDLSRMPTRQSESSFSLFPKKAAGDDPGLKTTSVPWNPNKPPKAPTLNNWLNVQDVSPFGPIKLPTDDKVRGPLGGQLKSPMRTVDPQASVFRLAMEKPIVPSEMAKSVKIVAQKPVQVVQRNPSTKSRGPPPKADPIPEPVPARPDAATMQAQDYQAAVRQSNASAWTDEVPFSAPYQSAAISPPPAPLGPSSVSQTNQMQLPAPRGPVRNTAEWLAEQGGGGFTETSITAEPKGKEKEKTSSTFQALGRMGLPSNPGRGRAYSMKAEVGNVQADHNRGRSGSEMSNGSRASNGVGKAL